MPTRTLSTMHRKTMPPRLDNYNHVLEVAGDIIANTVPLSRFQKFT
ncbi:hypothetical protein [Hallerella succinigenes]|uniref:Uncharacterized protein n=1 Tax=Hallerella succinigenes TaxID=1896222 RepID=A0A2M9A814_9BACT|nr:hypothetical protein [Hallerella succinigenes]PJJ41767.1 hypothetical protein BGX16_1761 [Hallerella succinigenes]